MSTKLPRLAVLAGSRTPFAKAFGALAEVPADRLGQVALGGALARAGLGPADVGEVVFGNVAGQADASNLARVIALRAGVPQDRVAHTVNRNCASGMEAVGCAWSQSTVFEVGSSGSRNATRFVSSNFRLPSAKWMRAAP